MSRDGRVAGLKAALTRVGLRAENLADRLIRRAREGRVIEPYIGYSTPETLIARGRVLASRRQREVQEDQSAWLNLREMVALFVTHEVADVTVETIDGAHEAVSDAEGYVTLVLPRAGWTGPVRVQVRGRPESGIDLPVMVPAKDARLGVISDIDDTLMRTGAYSLWRNLWTSLTGNVLTRKVHGDAVDLIAALHDGRNPVFYVSSSPWNLHGFLQQVFRRAGLAPGPMFLRDYGLSETQFITGTHGDHKGAAIDTILGANPDLPFVLIGDTGQHDAEVYLEAARRHPGRVARVILRAPGPGADASDLACADALREFGVPVFVGRDYRKVIGAIEAG